MPEHNLSLAADGLSKNDLCRVLSNESMHFPLVTLACAKIAGLPKTDLLENLFIMFSDNPHFWDDAQILLRRSENWQLSKIGNCGSPIETEAGWLCSLTALAQCAKYCIGAVYSI